MQTSAEVKEDAAEGPDVALLAEHVLELFGSAPSNSAELGRYSIACLIQLLGYPQVNQLNPLIVGTKQHVVGFEILVDNVLIVEVLDRRYDLARKQLDFLWLYHFVFVHADEVEKIATLQILHEDLALKRLALDVLDLNEVLVFDYAGVNKLLADVELFQQFGSDIVGHFLVVYNLGGLLDDELTVEALNLAEEDLALRARSQRL